MEILISAQCADKAIHSTSAIYHVAKATAKHGDYKVIEKMAKMEEATGTDRHQAIINATVRHKEIMALSESGPKYKQMAHDLDNPNGSPAGARTPRTSPSPAIATA